jgi:hypothetical protein
VANPLDPFAQAKFEDELRFLSSDYYIRRAREQVPPLNVVDFNGVFSDRAIALIGLQQLQGLRGIGNRDYRMFAELPPMPERVGGPVNVGELPKPSPDANFEGYIRDSIVDAGFGLRRGADPVGTLKLFIQYLPIEALLPGVLIKNIPETPGLTEFARLTILADLIKREYEYRQRIGVIGPNGENIGYGPARAAGLPGYYAQTVINGFVLTGALEAPGAIAAGVAGAGFTGLVDQLPGMPLGVPGAGPFGPRPQPPSEPSTTFPQVPIKPPVNPGTPGAPPGGIVGVPDGLFLANPADP